MIITRDILDKKVPSAMFPTRLDSALNLYSYIKDKGLVLYNVNPDTWNCLYTFFELNHKFTIDNYEFKNKDITFRELIEEYQKQYKKVYEINNGFNKDRRKQILVNEYKNTFDLDEVIIDDELESCYELKYSKSKNVWTLYYFENYVVGKIDDVSKLLNQEVFQQEFLDIDNVVNKVNGVDVVSNIVYLLENKENVDKLRKCMLSEEK